MTGEASREKDPADPARQRIVVFSGEGGVGKTTVAVNLAYAFSRRGIRVGLLDADITGPNVVQMAGVTENAHRGRSDASFRTSAEA